MSTEEQKKGRLPDFVIIGATKAGTTSLHFYLSLHPEIFMSTPKEPRFFADAPEPLGRWSRGLDWYRSLFVTGKRLCGETSPTYAAAPAIPGVPGRIAPVIPSAKLVYVVRHPYERLLSHYLMFYRTGRTALSFSDFIGRVPHALDSSCYGTQLAGYLNYFSPDQILVVESEALMKERAATMRQIFSFLGAEPEFKSPLFQHQRHVGWHEPYLSPRGRRLRDSRPVEKIGQLLPPNVFSALKNILLRPFSGPAPSTELPPDVKNRIDEKLSAEVQLLRHLTGLPLSSLGCDGPLKSAGAATGKDG